MDRRADGLLHGAEFTVKNACAGQAGDIADKAGAQTGQGIEAFGDETIKGSVNTVGGDQFGVAQIVL